MFVWEAIFMFKRLILILQKKKMLSVKKSPSLSYVSPRSHGVWLRWITNSLSDRWFQKILILLRLYWKLDCFSVYACAINVFQKHGIVNIIETRHDKTYRMIVRPAKTRISLGIRPVWSESSLCAQWVAKDPSFLHADSVDSDQTGRMPRLIWVFAGRTCNFVGFVMRRLIYCFWPLPL